MFNGITLWGNGQLLPLGPLREPLAALRRADVAIIHHANLVKNVDQTLFSFCKIIITHMTASSFFSKF